MLDLITGGSGSGKSEYAETLAVSAHKENPGGKLYYIATMYPYDEECLKRIEKHRRMRKEKGFTTIECYTRLKEIKVTKKDVVLLECMSNLLANEMYREEGSLKEAVHLKETDKEQPKDRLYEVILEPVFLLKEQAAHVIVVTNEVFSDGMEYEEETMRYVELLGRINCEIGEKADGVTEVVCGIPVLRKGEKRC